MRMQIYFLFKDIQSCTNNYSHFKNSAYISTGLCLRLRVLGHQTLNAYVAQTIQNELAISWLNISLNQRYLRAFHC